MPKFSSALMALAESEGSGKSSADNYLRYSKLESGKPANFALLTEDALEYYLVWGEANADGQMRPFRFLDEPTSEDIEAELGNEFSQCLNYERTGPRKPSNCLTYPVYNWDMERVQVLEVSHVTVIKQFMKYALNKKYSRNFLDWDFELSKITGDKTRYELILVPRDEDEHDEAAMEKAWKAVQKDGFDLNRIVTGGDPFSEG
jgi:hypothetical protein